MKFNGLSPYAETAGIGYQATVNSNRRFFRDDRHDFVTPLPPCPLMTFCIPWVLAQSKAVWFGPYLFTGLAARVLDRTQTLEDRMKKQRAGRPPDVFTPKPGFPSRTRGTRLFGFCETPSGRRPDLFVFEATIMAEEPRKQRTPANRKLLRGPCAEEFNFQKT